MTSIYRAVSFGQPVGPWRSERAKVRQDLIEQGLGSYDEWGSFFITVPGDIESKRSAQASAA